MHETLAELALKRPVFHSEADFQHAFAWELHVRHSDAGIRLEYPAVLKGNTRYIDMIIRTRRSITAIELKYRTRWTAVEHDGETFALRDHSAQDQGRYDFIKDIERLESNVAAGPSAKGFAIFITNDHGYWNPPARPNTIDSEFRIHDGQVLADTLSWTGAFGPGSVRGRIEPIRLHRRYTLEWRNYSSFDGVKHGRFRYLLVEV